MLVCKAFHSSLSVDRFATPKVWFSRLYGDVPMRGHAPCRFSAAEVRRTGVSARTKGYIYLGGETHWHFRSWPSSRCARARPSAATFFRAATVCTSR